jgi:hypothetical protein
MEPTWRKYEYGSCPNCGEKMEVFSKDDLWASEDEPVRCAARCGFESSIGFDDDGRGRIYVREGNLNELPDIYLHHATPDGNGMDGINYLLDK